MTAPTTQAPAPADAGGAKPKDKAPQVMLRPFKVGVQYMDEEPFDRTVPLTAATQNLDQWELPSTAFVTDFYVLVENTVTSNTATGTGTAAVGVLVDNGPYTVIDDFKFTDTNSNEIMGPFTGFDLYVISKWGGYCFQDDPEVNTDLFSATTNATASSSASGSFAFVLRVPIELVPRDALGALPNKSASTPFKVKIRVAPIASVYRSTSTVGGSCRFRLIADSYWEPTATDGSGNPVASLPPGVNTTQYWNVTPYTLTSGNISPLLTNSVGFPVRNLGFVLTDSNSSRSQGESDFPDPFQLQLQSNIIVNRVKKIWKQKITESTGYTIAGDSAGQKDNGLYWLWYCKDFYPKPGWESRRQYLRTTDGMRLQVKGSIGGTGVHTLTVYTNYVGIGKGTSLAALTT